MSALLLPSTRARGLTVVALLVVFATAACSSAATTAPTQPAGGSSATPTTAESAPAASEPTATEAASAGAVDFGSAATGLDRLDSYQFSVTIQSSDPKAGAPATTTFSGTVINKPAKAQTLDTVPKGADGTVGGDANSYVILPGTAYLKWLGDPVGWAQLQVDSSWGMRAFRPEQIFSPSIPGATDNTVVGDEQKNGVACTHYRGGLAPQRVRWEPDLGPLIATILVALPGAEARWSSDVWLAKDGGYLVHSEASGVAIAALGGGSFSIVVDITNINSSSNTVTAPM